MCTRVLVTPPILHTLHFTLVLTLLHTCQGQDHSLAKRRVETSVVRSAPTRKPRHQSQYSLQDSFLHLHQTSLCHIKFGCVSGPDLVSFLYADMCPDVQTQIRHGFYLHPKTPVICNLTRESCIVSLQSNKICTRALPTPTILHTLHTRPDITSQMSRAGSLTH